jgi:hypothetical protein
VKKTLTIVLAVAALAVTLSLVVAGSFKRGPGTALTSGDIASAAAGNAYAPTYAGVARIIHIPQRDERASVNDRDEPEATGNDDDGPVAAPPPRRRTTPRWPLHSDAPSPPPPTQRRSVLSAPPPAATGLTPIRPTPRFDSKADQPEKFGPSSDSAAAANSLPPPLGYTPPSALPQGD